MRDLIFTEYTNRFDTQGRIISRSWSEWVSVFSKHQIRGEPEDTNNLNELEKHKDGPALVLGKVRNNRKSENVIEINAFALDIEKHKQEIIIELVNKLSKFEFILYTTHKHMAQAVEGLPRVRIILPHATLVKAKEYHKYWEQLNTYIGNLNDPSTKDIGRLHYLPSTFDESLAEIYYNQGEWLDISQFPSLDSYKKIRHRLKSFPKNHELHSAMTALAKGAAFANKGNRHQTILDITMWLAQKIYPPLTEGDLEELFKNSLLNMQDENGPTQKEVSIAYFGALEKCNIKRPVGFSGDTYSQAELEKIAIAQKTTTGELHNRWVIVYKQAAWLLNSEGHYEGPFDKYEAQIGARDCLRRAPVQLTQIKKNEIVYRSVFQKLSMEAGRTVNYVEADLTTQNSYLDSFRGVLIEATAPRNDFKPQRHKQIDEWLKLLAGSFYDKLLDWLSIVPDTDKLLCALYFKGAQGSGKSLFVHGVSKIWREGLPTPLENMLGSFNSSIAKCPIIFGDEQIPYQYVRAGVTEKLREIISTKAHSLNRKYRNETTLRGALRLILAANHDRLLESKGALTADDREAIARRFLYIPVTNEATEYLEGQISLEERQKWEEHKIAEYTLWLAENHVVEQPGRRFWVEGSTSDMHRLLTTSSEWNSRVCDWLIRFLKQPMIYLSQNTQLIKFKDGQFLVNTNAIIDGWKLYFKDTHIEPELSKIGTALLSISESTRKQVRTANSSRRIWYYVIELDHLISFAQQYGLADAEELVSIVAHGGREPSNRDQVVIPINRHEDY